MLTRSWFVGIVTVYTLVFLLQVRCAPQAAHQHVEISSTAGRDHAFVDLSADGGSVRLKVPAKPEQWQKGPPCKRGEHALNGACYQRFTREDMSPPCDTGIYEHDGQCWRAIAKAPRQPTSVKE